jgi:hypothetical protein
MKYTREQLADMSDFDINTALTTTILGEPWLSWAEVTDSGCLHLADSVGNPYFHDIIDYCNNWNNIMPLAIKYNIALSPADNNPNGGQWYADRIFSNELESCWCDDKPQRAVACVLLLMEEI